jgi:TonB family protein
MGKMRISAIVSLLIHVLIFYALLTFFEIVPRVDLPERIYSVRIFSPQKAQKKKEPKKKEDVKVKKLKPKPKPVEKKKVVEKVKEKKPEKTHEPEPRNEKKNESIDISVRKEKVEETSVAVDAPKFPFSYYLSAIERKVSENWFSASVEHGKSISCTVFFRLDRSGRISALRMQEGSGDSYYDRAALRAIKSSVPFPPLPSAFDESALGIHFRFTQKD